MRTCPRIRCEKRTEDADSLTSAPTLSRPPTSEKKNGHGLGIVYGCGFINPKYAYNFEIT